MNLHFVPVLLASALLTSLLAAENSSPPPPGKMIDIGGYKMHIHITGEGGPAVVLEAGAGAFSLDWALVQEQVSKFTRVCSYERAGHAWSELGPRPRTMVQAAFSLHRLLQLAGVPPPYLMVGHSIGGHLIRIYTREYPQEVAGLVLVDSAVENNAMFINNKLVGPWDQVRAI